MANITTDINEKVFNLSKFYGVNENPDGDTHLKYGEASNMTNFRITDNYALQKRQGSRTVAGLLSAYSISVASTPTTVLTELNNSVAGFTVYPTISVSDGGILTLSDTPVTINRANISSYAGHYWRNETTNQIYQIGTCVYTEATGGARVTGGTVTTSSTDTVFSITNNPITAYSGLTITGGTVGVSGTSSSATSTETGAGKYCVNNNTVLKIKTIDVSYTYAYVQTDPGSYVIEGGRVIWIRQPSYAYVISGSTYTCTCNAVSVLANDTYSWNFKLATAVSGSSPVAVRGLWSGFVGCVEYMVAACDGKLWSLTESAGVWTKTEIGAITTTNGHVHMFGFSNKLYILDGTNYRVWNGTTLSLVTGYRPLVAIAVPPTGGGTTLEQVNKLNGTRRAWFSPNGTSTTFQLPEANLASVDYVKKTSDGSAVAYTANTTTGVVTISAAPATGVNSIEIGWTVSTNSRTRIISMKYSETYNGETDTRVFLYGDGSNTALYSGLDYNGNPTAEYFPDLNEIAVDSANTPITAMIKHYDRLLTFKTDGAFITTYGTITLADNTVTAGFYTSPLNREIGHAALGQAALVKNNPFTLYGRSVYEWQLSSYASKDERNAKTKSDRVAETLSTFDLSKAICYDDEIHSEYYVIQNGHACVYNYKADAWYIYTDMPATCMINYQQEIYYGDTAGNVRHFSRDYMNDNGATIQCYWESGSMDFGSDFKRKYSPCLWIGIKPEDNGEIYVSVDTDRATDYSDESVTAQYTDGVVSGFFSFLDLDFTKLSFNINSNPQMHKLAIKVKKFVYYKLIFSTNTADTTATVTSADIRVRYTGNVR